MIQRFGVVRRASERRGGECELLKARKDGIETVIRVCPLEEPCTIWVPLNADIALMCILMHLPRCQRVKSTTHTSGRVSSRYPTFAQGPT